MVPVLLVVLAVGPVRGDAETITDAIRAMLSLKGTKFPYSAEYDLALPPAPRIAGRTEKRRFFAANASSLYSEQSDDVSRLQAIISDKKLLFGYSDIQHDLTLFTGPVDLDAKSPERWLEDHAFIHNSYSALDADLVLVIYGLLVESKVTQHEKNGNAHTYHLSGSQLGDLVVRLGPKSVEIDAVVPGAAPVKSKNVFRYLYRDGPAPWSAGAVKELKTDFEKAGAKKVHKLTGEIDMFVALQEAFGGENEIRVISPAESKALAERHGYLLPTAPKAKSSRRKTLGGNFTWRLSSTARPT